MTRQQIRRLYFRREGRLVSVQAVCRRLRLLSERGYLYRVRLPAMQGSGPYVYRAGKMAVVALDKGNPGRSRSALRGRAVHSFAGLYHGLEVVDFYLSLKEGLEDRGGRIVSWLGERQAHYRFEWNGRRVLLSPDGYCLWALGTVEGAFFLEWDRGTESMNRLSEKLERYQVYYQLQAYHHHIGELGLKPRLLIVVPDERRERKVVAWIARQLSRGHFDSLPTVLITAGRWVYTDVLGPVWSRPGAEGRVTLVD
jgi:hypothetical protein